MKLYKVNRKMVVAPTILKAINVYRRSIGNSRKQINSIIYIGPIDVYDDELD